MKPDAQTQLRISNLARVGSALNSLASDVSQNTSYYVAKEALDRFTEGIDQLELDAESKKGIKDLIEYLDNKIDKRLKIAV